MNEEMSLPVNVGISIKLYMNCTANSFKFLLESYKVIIAWFGFESWSSKVSVTSIYPQAGSCVNAWHAAVRPLGRAKTRWLTASGVMGHRPLTHHRAETGFPRPRQKRPATPPRASWPHRQLVFDTSTVRFSLSAAPARLTSPAHRASPAPFHGGGSPLLLRTGRLSRREPPPLSYPWPSRPPGHTIERLLPLPRVAQPRRLAGRARAPQSQDGATDEEAVPAGALLPHLPAAARPTPAGGHQVPRRRLHRRRPRGHLRVSSLARGFHSSMIPSVPRSVTLERKNVFIDTRLDSTGALPHRAVGCWQLPAGAPGAGGLSDRVRAVQRHLQPRGRCARGLPEVPCLLRRAPRFGAPGGQPERPGHRGAPALLGWPQVISAGMSHPTCSMI